MPINFILSQATIYPSELCLSMSSKFVFQYNCVIVNIPPRFSPPDEFSSGCLGGKQIIHTEMRMERGLKRNETIAEEKLV